MNNWVHSKANKQGVAAVFETGPKTAAKKHPLRDSLFEQVQSIHLAVAALAVEQLTWGQVRVANELAKKGMSNSPAGVRCVWARHDLENTKKRLKALEAKVAQEGLILMEAQVHALDKAKLDKERPRGVGATATAAPRTRFTWAH